MASFEKLEAQEAVRAEIKPVAEKVPSAEVREEAGFPSQKALEDAEKKIAELRRTIREEGVPGNFMLVARRGEYGAGTESHREIAVLPSIEEAERLKALLAGFGRKPEDFVVEETSERADIQDASEYSRMAPRKQKEEISSKHSSEERPGFWEKVRAGWQNFLENYV